MRNVTIREILPDMQLGVTDKNYITFACYSLSKGEDVDFKELKKQPPSSNGESGWYNHSIYRPEALHFCSAITTDNLRKLNGFDERLALGLGYEDNLFIHQVRVLGLKVLIVDDPFVFHQYHYDIKSFNFDVDLYNRTGFYFKQLRSENGFRAKHLITNDF